MQLVVGRTPSARRWHWLLIPTLPTTGDELLEREVWNRDLATRSRHRLAVASGNTEAVLRLLADGAHADGDPRHNPLEAAVRAKAADLASALLNAGANPNGGYDVPLVAAAWNGDVALLELLLERGANVNKADWKDRTPLHAAVHGHRDAAVGWLLANGAVPQSSGNAMTALHWLMYTEPPSLSVLQSLLAAGAYPQADDRRGSQPLHYVAGTDCLTIVQTLLRAGADALAGNKLGSTPLHMAALGGSLDVLEAVLAAAGPDVNPVDMRGRTPLHYAAVADRDLPIVEALLGAGAALDARDGRNRTAHALAEYWSTKPVVVQRLAGGQ